MPYYASRILDKLILALLHEAAPDEFKVQDIQECLSGHRYLTSEIQKSLKRLKKLGLVDRRRYSLSLNRYWSIK